MGQENASPPLRMCGVKEPPFASPAQTKDPPSSPRDTTGGDNESNTNWNIHHSASTGQRPHPTLRRGRGVAPLRENWYELNSDLATGSSSPQDLSRKYSEDSPEIL